VLKPPILLPLLLSLALLPACQGGGSSGGNDGGMDSGTGTDSDSETEIDTSWDGGPTTPCTGSPGPGEVCIRGGTYLMGCMPYDTWCEDNEYPMVEVALSPFWIDLREATYEHVMAWMNTLGDEHIKDNQWLRDPEGNILFTSAWDTSPPICYDADAGEYDYDPDCHDGCGGPPTAAAGGLTWLGAKRFCEHWGKRLPTEAEWEAAARGQTKLIWPCDWEHKPCWHGKYAMCYENDECYVEICCAPDEDDTLSECNSPYGVQGLYGNAAEWTLDGADPDHSWCQDGCTDPAPRPPNDEGAYVGKGGCIATDATWTRISARMEIEFGSPPVGVRCVRSPVSFGEPDAGPDGGK